MKPTEILMQEHRVIEQVLNCVEKMTDRAEVDGRLDPESARQAIDFLRTFADRCHHGKEEEQLFPMMEQRGFSPQEGPTAVMRSEHETGRSLIARMDGAIDEAAAGKDEALREFAESADAYVVLLRRHIEKEDQCLFPMADGALSPEDQQDLLRRFEHVEHHDLGDGVHQRYLEIADRLARHFDVPRVTGEEAVHRCGCGHDHG